ncbi:MAG: hypothetical protein WCE68_11905 [Anaerolineales bacterium]
MNSKEESIKRRQVYLRQLRRILPVSESWETWLDTSRELPPDFSTMPSSWSLPDPLELVQNDQKHSLNSLQDWDLLRNQLKEQLQQWIFGTIPPGPGNVHAHILETTPQFNAISQKILLTFGPDQKANLHLELLIPQGNGPFPVFLTQSDHRGWALIALQRGYIGGVYAACDSQDDSEGFRAIYPEFDWGTLARRAWAASRAMDYLITLPQVDPHQIILTGHSRNAKQALIASALDERIAAVIASSAGAIGALPARFFSEQHFGEGIELITRVFPDWFHPRLRFFTGREDRLPVDMHELIALSAPRFCLLSSALNDRCESTWAVQQTFLAARRFYQFLGAGQNLDLIWRSGGHETYSEIIERYLDWCDGCFGHSRPIYTARFVYPVNRTALSKHQAPARSVPAKVCQGLPQVTTQDEWQKAKANIIASIPQLLGQEPPKVDNPGHDYGTEVPHLAILLDHETDGNDLTKKQIMFGEYINADIYLPREYETRQEKIPAVLWLPPFSFPNGYRAAFFYGEQFYIRLARQGYAVFCFDPIGMGRRVEEAEYFYRRYPNWSLLGKMLRDALSALDVLVRLPYVDPTQIFGVGYGLGSLVGLHLAAVDNRLTGYTAVCIPPFYRSGNESIQWISQFDLVPCLAESKKNADELPYTSASLMACMAPRPLLVVSPQLDRETSMADITACIESARQIYSLSNSASSLSQESPEDYNHLSIPIQQMVLDWLSVQVGKKENE